ncbi:MAG: methyl-accepting chemotaxis protein [Actinomycetia bacterium]|nr:methyl-accepting chemotaxis protein [Actinomycetes bacterium]
MSRVPLKIKLSVLLLVPMVGMTVFAVSGAAERRAEAGEAEDLQLLVELSVKTGNLLHETQKERGASAVYMGSAGQRFQSETQAQQATTDGPRAEFVAFLQEHSDELPPEVVAGLEPAARDLGQLDTIRAEALSLSAETSEVITYFTMMNGRFLDGIAAVASASSNAELRGDSIAYLAFLNAKEKTGVERAQLAAAFASDEFAPGQLVTVVTLIAAQEAYLGLFQDIANPSALGVFEEKQSDPLVAEVARLEAVAVNNGVGGFGVDGGSWFDTMTSRINLLKEVEDFQADHIAQTSHRVAVDARAALYRSLTMAAIIIIFSTLFGVLTLWGLVRQLRRIVDRGTLLAEGDTSGEPLEIHARDEVGQVAASFNAVSDHLTLLNTIASQASAVANKDLASPILDSDVPGEIGVSFSTMVNSLRVMVDDLKTGSEHLSSSAQELSRVSTSLSSSAVDVSTQASEAAATSQEVTSEVGSVAAAIVEMDASFSDVASHTASASEMADRAVQAAGRNSTVISKLSESGDRIGKVVAVISSIAEQTNLLALNATIEAARAGAAGKGFTVVADEVKQLANQTATATEEISENIRGIQEDMAEAVEANEQICEMVGSMNDISIVIATALEEQSATSAEIGRRVQSASSGTNQISATIENVSATATTNQRTTTDLDSAATKMSDLAASLNDLVADYTLSTPTGGNGETDMELAHSR